MRIIEKYEIFAMNFKRFFNCHPGESRNPVFNKTLILLDPAVKPRDDDGGLITRAGLDPVTGMTMNLTNHPLYNGANHKIL